MKFGAHVSISGGIFNAPRNGLDSRCDVVQIFTKNQMQWKVPELTNGEIEKFQAVEARTGIEVVCVHASYLINLGGFDAHKLQRSRENFIIEMARAEALRIPYLVVHPGSHMGEGEEEGIRRIAESLDITLDRTEGFRLKILLETTAGQGDNLGYRFEQLAGIRVRVGARARVGYCIDTCHIFAAGYELRTAPGYSETIRQLDDTLGADNVGIIHVNDSKREFGSRRDRHEHIGDGEIGLAGFANLVNDARFRKVPFIIETPGPASKDAENLARLRSLVVSNDSEENGCGN